MSRTLDHDTIGDCIKAGSEAAGLTQQQLVDAIGAGGGRQQTSNWENGQRTPLAEPLARIAKVCWTAVKRLVLGE